MSMIAEPDIDTIIKNKYAWVDFSTTTKQNSIKYLILFLFQHVSAVDMHFYSTAGRMSVDKL